FGNGDRLNAAISAAALDAGIDQDVLDEMAETIGFSAQGGEILLAAGFIGDHAPLEHFAVHGKRGEGSSQFVGDGGDECAAALAESHCAPEEKGDGGGADGDADPGDEEGDADRGIQVGEIHWKWAG